MSLQDWALVVNVLIGAGALKAVEALWKWSTGSSGRQRDRMHDLIADRDVAEARADREADCRRSMQEHAATVRAIAIIGGVFAENLPAIPVCPPS